MYICPKNPMITAAFMIAMGATSTAEAAIPPNRTLIDGNSAITVYGTPSQNPLNRVQIIIEPAKYNGVVTKINFPERHYFGEGAKTDCASTGNILELLKAGGKVTDEFQKNVLSISRELVGETFPDLPAADKIDMSKSLQNAIGQSYEAMEKLCRFAGFPTQNR